jgi:hypothetical protein
VKSLVLANIVICTIGALASIAMLGLYFLK